MLATTITTINPAGNLSTVLTVWDLAKVDLIR